MQIKLVLKEDVAGLYETSWELFVQGSSARQMQRCPKILLLPQKYAHEHTDNAPGLTCAS